MGKLVKHLLNASGRLDSYLEFIGKALKEVEERANEQFDFADIDVTFSDSPYAVIPEIGMGGVTSERGDMIYIPIDSARDLKYIEFTSTLYHEVNHAVRTQGKIGWKDEVIARVVSEGLACAYEEEMTGRKPIYAEVTLAEKLVSKIRSTDHSDLSANDWLFGTDGIPRWFGYSYGYKLTIDYAKKYKKKQHELVHVAAKEIWNS